METNFGPKFVSITSIGSLENLCISQMFFSMTFQSKHLLHCEVQSAHRKRGSSHKYEVSSYSTRKQYYQWGGYSRMDLLVDEQGLWVIVGQSSSGYLLHLGKVDVVKNSRPLSWNLRTSNYNYFPIKLTIKVHKRNK